MLKQSDEPHEPHRADMVMSSICMSDEKSNELLAPHLHWNDFFIETIRPPRRKAQFMLINIAKQKMRAGCLYSTVTDFARFLGLSGSLPSFNAR